MAVTAQSVADLCRAAQDASRVLATLDSATKNAASHAVADALEARTPEILEANARDMDAGRESGLSPALLDRLALDERARRRDRRGGCASIAALPDPVGEVIDGFRLANGLDVRKVRVPLGVDRGRLRGPPERHDRRRRAAPEVRQRHRPARLLVGGPLQRRSRVPSPPTPPSPPASPRARSSWRPVAAARSSRSSRPRTALSTSSSRAAVRV